MMCSRREEGERDKNEKWIGKGGSDGERHWTRN